MPTIMTDGSRIRPAGNLLETVPAKRRCTGTLETILNQASVDSPDGAQTVSSRNMERVVGLRAICQRGSQRPSRARLLFRTTTEQVASDHRGSHHTWRLGS
jgi:hypothetical protein